MDSQRGFATFCSSTLSCDLPPPLLTPYPAIRASTCLPGPHRQEPSNQATKQPSRPQIPLSSPTRDKAWVQPAYEGCRLCRTRAPSKGNSPSMQGVLAEAWPCTCTASKVRSATQRVILLGCCFRQGSLSEHNPHGCGRSSRGVGSAVYCGGLGRKCGPSARHYVCVKIACCKVDSRLGELISFQGPVASQGAEPTP